MLLLRKRKQDELLNIEERLRNSDHRKTNKLIDLGDVLRNQIWPFLNDNSAIALCSVDSRAERFYSTNQYPLKRYFEIESLEPCIYFKLGNWNLHKSFSDQIWGLINQSLSSPLWCQNVSLKELQLCKMSPDFIQVFLTKTINLHSLKSLELKNPGEGQLQLALPHLRRIPCIKIINNQSLNALIQILQHNDTLTSLTVDYDAEHRVRVSDMDQLLQHTSNLLSLCFTFVTNYSDQYKNFSHLRQAHMKNIKSLSFENFATNAILEQILSELPQLEHLNVAYGVITNVGLDKLTQVFSDVNKPCLITDLNIRGNNIEEGCETFLKCLSTNNTLRILDVNDNFDGQNLTLYLHQELKALQPNQSLERISLDGHLSSTEDIEKVVLFVMSHSSVLDIKVYTEKQSTGHLYKTTLAPYFRMNKYKKLQSK